MTIDELKEYCRNEFSSVERIENELFTVYEQDKTDYSLVEKAAISALMVNIYSGIERILKQMLIFDKLEIGDSPDWHEKVLRKSGEIGILPPDLVQIAWRYLQFRNYFIYTYIFDIEWNEMKDLIDNIRDVIARVRREVDEYLESI